MYAARASDCPRPRWLLAGSLCDSTLPTVHAVSPRAQVGEAVSCTRRCTQSAKRPRARAGRPRRRSRATGTRGRPRRSAPCPGTPRGAARRPNRRRTRGVARAWRRCRLGGRRETRGRGWGPGGFEGEGADTAGGRGVGAAGGSGPHACEEDAALRLEAERQVGRLRS